MRRLQVSWFLSACVGAFLSLPAPARAQTTFLPEEVPNPDGLTLTDYPRFGTSVASVGDVNGDGVPDFAVAAQGESRVFLFSGSDRSLLWTIDTPISVSSRSYNSSVLAVGEVNGDGVPDLLVNTTTQQALVLDVTDGAVLVTIANPEATPSSFSPRWAAIGDLNGDGFEDFAGGVQGQNVGTYPGQGRAFVFSGEDGHVLLTLDDPYPQSTDQCCGGGDRGALFGEAVVGLGDVDGDQIPDIAVGAQAQTFDAPDPFLYNQGEVFVFSGATGNLLYEVPYTGTWSQSEFGGFLAAPGDVTGDGVPDLVVGAPWDRVGGVGDIGEVYVFSGATGDLVRTLNSAPYQHETFGLSVAAVGDIDQDGFSDILVGGPVDKAFVYSAADGSLLYTLDDPSPSIDWTFSFLVAGLGDLNRDGVPDVLVVPVSCCDPDPGRVYLFLSTNTDTGSDVVIDPIDPETGLAPVELTFANVTTPGATGLTITDSGPAIPAGFALGNPPTYFDITTTAVFDGTVTVCIDYSGVSYTDQNQLQLLHFDGASWVDTTTSIDTVNHIICGEVTSFSPFAIVEPAQNQNPVAAAGAAQTVECTSPSGAAVTLDGSGSSDPDGQALSYSWSGPFGAVSGVSPTVTLPLGTSTITLTVDDGFGGTASDTVTVTVQDTTAPTISVGVSPTVLWPPDQTLATIAADVQVTDACSATPLAVTLMSIVSNEPDSGDVQAGVGTDDRSFLLRASRLGSGSGRTYTITYSATDAAGNLNTATAFVTVPHDLQ